MSLISFGICLWYLSTEPPVAMNSGSFLPALQNGIYFYLFYTDLLELAMNIAGHAK